MQTETLITAELKIAVRREERQQAINMLENHGLPISDIQEDTLLYVLYNNSKIMGTGGLEIFEDCALLRSVSVIKEAKGKGYGTFIVDSLESFAKESGINCLYLITTTAKDFFDRHGFCTINREEVPPAIKQTAQFSSLCPSTAVVMKKRI